MALIIFINRLEILSHSSVLLAKSAVAATRKEKKKARCGFGRSCGSEPHTA
jgi:hypothetical protein